MKRTQCKRLAVMLLCVLCAALLAGCGGKLKGTYAFSGDLLGLAGSSVRYAFSGDRVTVTAESSLLGYSDMEEHKGTYKLDEKAGTITLIFDTADANEYAGTFPFQRGEDFISIDGVTLKKEA